MTEYKIVTTPYIVRIRYSTVLSGSGGNQDNIDIDVKKDKVFYCAKKHGGGFIVWDDQVLMPFNDNTNMNTMFEIKVKSKKWMESINDLNSKNRSVFKIIY